MRGPGEEIRVQVPISADAVAKIDELALRMRVGRGRMAAMLLEQGLEDNEWIIRFVTSGVMRQFRDVVEGWKKKPGRVAVKPT